MLLVHFLKMGSKERFRLFVFFVRVFEAICDQKISVFSPKDQVVFSL